MTRRLAGEVLPSAGRREQGEQLDALVRAARAGDNHAWTRLIARYDRTVRAIARGYRLRPADVDDVAQITWARLYQHIDGLREPRAIPSWLATTARREAMLVLRASRREQPSDDPELGDHVTADRPDAAVLAAEERTVLARALAALPGRQRDLMILLAAQPDADYQHISATLAMPIGSIGPVRARGLARLGRDTDLRRHYFGTA